MEDDTGPAPTGVYRSRAMREMNARRQNPFHSPPSSTGSHGTVSPTQSSVFSEFEGESTRQLNRDMRRVTAPRQYTVNWDAAHRKWPEFYSAPKETKATAAGTTTRKADGNSGGSGVDAERLRQVLAANVQPRTGDDTTHEVFMGSNRTRAELQTRVENESDDSSVLVRSPAQQLTGLSGMQENTRQQGTARGSLDSKPKRVSSNQSRQPSKPSAPAKEAAPRGPPLTLTNANLNRLGIPKPVAAAAAVSLMASPGQNLTANLTSRSFAMPDISHLGDFVSGSLKYSGNTKNGVPVFVKHGKVHDKVSEKNIDNYADVDGLQIPDDEEKIFVSMDILRDEIISLQEHDGMVQQYADELQLEIQRLQVENRKLKFDRANDSGLGSASESDSAANKQLVAKRRLESEVLSLRTRLEDATRKLSATEAHTTSMSSERDRAMRKLQDACENIGDLMNRLDHQQKELQQTQRQLDDSRQVHLDNETLRQDALTAKRACETLRGENRSLRADNETLRRDHESLMAENQSLRASIRALMKEADGIRTNSDAFGRDLEAARLEIENLRADLQAVDVEKKTFQDDNESLVRHNEKYFNENKGLRRENSGFERSIHDLHDENLRLREEVDFLKQQLDHCRPIGREMDETEENMTSAFFVPDITMHSNEASGAVDVSEQGPPDVTATQGTTRQQRGLEATDVGTRNPTVQSEHSSVAPEAPKQAGRKQVSRAGSNSQKVAFSLPGPGDQDTTTNKANKGSKRRSVSGAHQRGSHRGETETLDDTTGLLPSVESTQNHSVIVENAVKGKKEAAAAAAGKSHRTASSVREAICETTRDRIAQHENITIRSHNKRVASAKPNPVHATSAKPAERAPGHAPLPEPTQESSASVSVCPALSPSARRVLDELCEHSCRNCTVCVRITAHRHAPGRLVTAAADVAAGKKRVTVPRPVPVTDRIPDVTADDPTVRPSQPPGEALALVIKSITDEIEHMKMRHISMMARYNKHDPSVARRARRSLGDAMCALFERIRNKEDQVYALHDVLLGLRDMGLAMDEEQLEMTVFEITGASMRDLTESMAW